MEERSGDTTTPGWAAQHPIKWFSFQGKMSSARIISKGDTDHSITYMAVLKDQLNSNQP